MASWRFPAATAACALLAGLAACSSPAPPASPGPSRSASSPAAAATAQLTIAQATAIFTAFEPRFRSESKVQADAAQVGSGPETAALAFGDGSTEYQAGTLSGLRVLVPEESAYPRWFVAAGTSPYGKRGFLFLMLQQSAGAPWREAAEYYDLSSPPELMSYLSQAGFKSSLLVTAEPSDDPDLAVIPSKLSADLAAYLDDDARGAQRRHFYAGGYTTAAASQTRQLAAASSQTGWDVTDRQLASKAPVYTIDMPAGGALVFFHTTEQVRWTATSSAAQIASPDSAGNGVPGQFLAQLHITAATAGLKVTATATDEILAWVAPLAAGKVTILVNDGKIFALRKS